MTTKNSAIFCRVLVVWVAVALVLSGCSAAKLKEVQDRFSVLVEQRQALVKEDATWAKRNRVPATREEFQALERSTMSNWAALRADFLSLSKAALATEPDIDDPRTKIAVLRIAALSGWLAGGEGSSSMAGAKTKGGQLCKSLADSGQVGAPRDCALIEFAPYLDGIEKARRGTDNLYAEYKWLERDPSIPSVSKPSLDNQKGAELLRELEKVIGIAKEAKSGASTAALDINAAKGAYAGISDTALAYINGNLMDLVCINDTILSIAENAATASSSGSVQQREFESEKDDFSRSSAGPLRRELAGFAGASVNINGLLATYCGSKAPT